MALHSTESQPNRLGGSLGARPLDEPQGSPGDFVNAVQSLVAHAPDSNRGVLSPG